MPHAVQGIRKLHLFEGQVRERAQEVRKTSMLGRYVCVCVCVRVHAREEHKAPSPRTCGSMEICRILGMREQALATLINFEPRSRMDTSNAGALSECS